MKIVNSQLQQIRALYRKLVKRKEGVPSSPAAAGARGPQESKAVAPTNYGDIERAVRQREYEFAVRAVADAPDIRLEKIERLQKMIAAGTYRVSEEEVAGALLESGVLNDVLGG